MSTNTLLRGLYPITPNNYKYSNLLYMIQVTKNAWTKMSQIIRSTKNHYGFIYSASSGGCNGFNFELSLLNQNKWNDISLCK